MAVFFQIPPHFTVIDMALWRAFSVTAELLVFHADQVAAFSQYMTPTSRLTFNGAFTPCNRSCVHAN